MTDRMRFDVALGSTVQHRPPRRTTEDPFRILILGRFSTAGEDADSIPVPTPRRVDIDNFAALMRGMAPSFHLQLDDDQAALSGSCTSLDDFHPDALYQKLPVFAELRELRRQLADPAQFAAAAAGMSATVADQTPRASGETRDDLLGRLLGARPAATPAPTQGLDRFIQQLVAPYISPDHGDRQAAYLDAVDQSISALMRKLLHHPAFQSLESNWRCLWQLVSNIEDETIQVTLLDLDPTQLREQLLCAPEQSSLYQQLIGLDAGIPGASPWSVLIHAFPCTDSDEDLVCLAALGQLAASCGAPCISAADASLLHLAETPAASATGTLWQRLRRSSVAPWLALTLPRVLVRLPYGASTDPIESFSFEEMDAQRAHEDYLWGNPALACAQMLCADFMQDGWEMDPDSPHTLDDLPAHSYVSDGESQLQACAEIFTSEAQAMQRMQQGFMPLLSVKHLAAIRLLRFQSIADPGTALRGAWQDLA